MKQLILILLFSTTVIFTGCKDETPSNGRIKFSVNITSSNVGNVGGRLAAANDLVFTSGTITIREVVFE